MPLRHKRKDSTGYTWTGGDLAEGQLGINIFDGTLHVLKSAAGGGGYVAIAADQNLWKTVAADTGSAAANTTTDTLTIAGGTSITTSIAGDVLTIDADDHPIIVTHAASDAESTTTNTTYIEKLKLTFTANAADYLITWSAEMSSDNSSAMNQVRFEQDDTTTLNEQAFNAGTNSFSHCGGTVVVTLTAASHDFDIDFSSSQASKIVRIRRARIFAQEIV